mmetsp:Transcript_43651/g.115278  ORF Transcript_43651/g.115278 Transcript_43651/m.115278 type:complete len:364 (+) Transcript_43651:284-1375(+)
MDISHANLGEPQVTTKPDPVYFTGVLPSNSLPKNISANKPMLLLSLSNLLAKEHCRTVTLTPCANSTRLTAAGGGIVGTKTSNGKPAGDSSREVVPGRPRTASCKCAATCACSSSSVCSTTRITDPIKMDSWIGGWYSEGIESASLSGSACCKNDQSPFATWTWITWCGYNFKMSMTSGSVQGPKDLSGFMNSSRGPAVPPYSAGRNAASIKSSKCDWNFFGSAPKMEILSMVRCASIGFKKLQSAEKTLGALTTIILPAVSGKFLATSPTIVLMKFRPSELVASQKDKRSRSMIVVDVSTNRLAAMEQAGNFSRISCSHARALNCSSWSFGADSKSLPHSRSPSRRISMGLNSLSTPTQAHG